MFTKCSREEKPVILHSDCCKLDHLKDDLKHDVRESSCSKQQEFLSFIESLRNTNQQSASNGLRAKVLYCLSLLSSLGRNERAHISQSVTSSSSVNYETKGKNNEDLS